MPTPSPQNQNSPSGLHALRIFKTFGRTPVLKDITFQVAPGEILAVLGPSGCGKSTLLAVIAGLERADSGEVFWEGKSLAGVPPHKRGFGLMFQDFALFPHRNVFANVAFGLQMAGMGQEAIRRRVAEVLSLVGLDDFAKRDVNTLSGGENQRVALARALAPNPRLLMLDEPLGSLDKNLRETLVGELRNILKASGQTAIYVTHDQEEAFVIADRVVVMNQGQVEQIDTPKNIFCCPSSLYVAQFLGLNNLFSGQIVADVNQGAMVKTPLGDFPVQSEQRGEVTVLLRPDAISLQGDKSCSIEAVLAGISFRGSTIQAEFITNQHKLKFEFPSQTPLPAPGERIRLSFNPQEALQIFPKQERN